MSADGADDGGGSYLPLDEREEKHTANESENASGESRQEDPDASRKYASYTTHTESLRCTGQGRGRQRDLDNHASWRDVYRANSVEVEPHE